MSGKSCYCSSGNVFDVCCEPFMNGVRLPETAVQLMRSRYTAYALTAVDYIIQTTHISTRNQYNAASIREWAAGSQWIKLEVLNTIKGTHIDSIGNVEFKAYYKDSANISQIHHEFSTFGKEHGTWFFVKGIVF